MNTAVSADMTQQLTKWSQDLAKSLGDSLQSIVLFGGLAKGEFVPGHSDANVAIVFKSVSVSDLDRAAPLIRQGSMELRLSAMLVTEAELRDAADVFPIKFQDMQRRHKVLWGEDPFPKVSIAREHLRLRCEQELRNLALRLRQLYVQRLDRPEMLQRALSRAVSSLLLNVGVLCELKTGKASATKQEALGNAAQLGVPTEAIQKAWSLKRGEIHLDAPGLKTLFTAFMDSVQQIAELADKIS